MSKGIGVFNFKGGVGKTFISSHLLFYLASKKNKCLGVDFDNQADLMKWCSGYKFDMQGKAIKSNNIDLLWGVHPDFEDKGIDVKVLEGYDYIVVDSRPSLDSVEYILNIVSTLVVPIKGRLSLEAGQELNKLCKMLKSNVRIVAVRNEVLPNRIIANRDELMLLNKLGIDLCPVGIMRSVAVRKAESVGSPCWLSANGGGLIKSSLFDVFNYIIGV